MTPWQALAETARERFGLTTPTDARRVGIARSTFHDHALQRGWEHVRPGVWALPGSRPSVERDLAAALLCLGPPAAVARRSAAWLWGLRSTPPPTPELLCPHGRALRSRRGIHILRTRSFTLDDVVALRGLPVTSAARTLADLARITDADALAGMIVQARQKGLVNIAQLAAATAALGNAPGSARFRRAVERTSSRKVDSLLELVIRERLPDYGLPPPAPEPLWLPVPDGSRRQLDIAWPGQRVGLEVDGFAYHSSPDDLMRDHAKQNLAAVLAWVLLRVGWNRWHHDRAAFIEELRAVLLR